MKEILIAMVIVVFAAFVAAEYFTMLREHQRTQEQLQKIEMVLKYCPKGGNWDGNILNCTK